MRDAMSVLIRPVVSEKSYALMERSVYVFIIDRHATKIDVRHAVEQAFSVRVTKNGADWFIWKKEKLEVTPARLDEIRAFSAELADLLLPHA